MISSKIFPSKFSDEFLEKKFNPLNAENKEKSSREFDCILNCGTYQH